MADNPIDRFYTALAQGDAAAARAALTPDARIWHGFDGLSQDVDTASAAWEQMFAGTLERGAADVRREAIEGGFLQRHMFFAKSKAGDTVAWPCCIVVRIEGDLIAGIDEYMDRAGAFPVSGDNIVTPRQ